MKRKLIILTIIYIIVELFFLYAYAKSYVLVFNNKFDRNEVVLDLSSYPIEKVSEWQDKLVESPILNTVIISDKTMNLSDREYLKEKYPDIDFFVTANIDFNGKVYREDAKEIDLTDFNGDESIIDGLSYFYNLEHVLFSDSFNNLDLQLTLKEKYPHVNFDWNIDLLGTRYSSETEGLYLENAKIYDLDTFKKSLKLFNNLKYIDLSDCNLSNEELYSIRMDNPSVKVVWKIYFSVWSMKTDAKAFSVLIANFPYFPLTSKDLEIFKYATDLEALDLGHQEITDITAIGNYLPNLRILILADNQITDIAPISKLKHLHYVELFINGISDITPLTKCKELVDINLANNPRIKDYSPLINSDLDMVERLWINNTRISKDDLNLLKEKYPDATIITDGYASTHFGWREHERYFAMIDMFHKRNYVHEAFSKYDK